MYNPSLTWALGDNKKLQRVSLLFILYWLRNAVGIGFWFLASTKRTERTDFFAWNFASDNQHIFSIPIIKQSQITQTHALWLEPVICVLVNALRHSCNLSSRFIVLHKSGTVSKFSWGGIWNHPLLFRIYPTSIFLSCADDWFNRTTFRLYRRREPMGL